MFQLSGKIAVVKDRSYMFRRCSAIGCLTNFKIFKGILFIPEVLLLSKFVISLEFVFFLLQGDITNDSPHGLVR